ncbi:hypothetical protein K493DRAFT_82451 [Basidiobolus meristosporus CBS 931.73]|uniref:Knr4/Smi1-like domain-containing protein n=1 Tax=Basidiobolus meristosporus CBS 931.73 TaxID=1314790 RepID=A0A1Y1XMI7_9FUNG|nr:hypothetical protein K493DRAFT_82451 [Basidiobolus meristosporus CBS 931.73]|eukprot:ORX86942.1 hypothetical protein K493DRAFT_82451 [Basidiobolus meristosporus CBS 931.73]
MPSMTLCRLAEEARELGQKLIEKGIYFQLPLPEQRIRNFEREYMIRLPEDYRAVLCLIGNGTYPSGGLLPLSYVPYEYPVPYKDLLIKLSDPFPLTQNLVFDEVEECLSEDFLDSLNHGHLVLASDDYLTHWILIVEGPARGEVWRRKSDYGFTRWATKMNFFTWLEERLMLLGTETSETSDEESDLSMDCDTLTDEASDYEWEDVKDDVFRSSP